MTTFREKIILPEDDEQLLALCEVQTFRSTGAGGQHINTTNSAVRLIYKPENIVVTCQAERSQYLNKMICIRKLREKVAKLNYRAPKRIATRIPYRAKEEGLAKKSKHSEKKKLRRKIDYND